MNNGYKALDRITRSDIEEEVGTVAAGVAERIHERLKEIVRNYGADTPDTWRSICERVLSPDLPFSFHQMMYYGCYNGYGADPPAWIPDPGTAILTNVGHLLERRGKDFSDLQEFSVSNPEVYWKTVLDEMSISFSWESNSSEPVGQWLPGAFLNPAENCLSLNSKRSLEDIAVIWRDEGDDILPVNRMTVREFRTEVWLVAHAIKTLGLDKGSAIAIDMPMNVNSVVIYLAIVLAGYVVVSIADSFAPREISTRLKISEAKAIFTQDLIIRGDKSIPLYSHQWQVVIPARGSSFSMKLRDGDISWPDFLGRVKHFKECEFAAVEQPVEAFTTSFSHSGTTAKGNSLDQCNTFEAAADAWCHLDIHKGDVVAWPTNLGWMMEDAKVTMLGVIPSIVRAWKSTNCMAGYDWSAIRLRNYGFLSQIWMFQAVFAQSLAAFSTPAMGCSLFILGSDGYPIPENVPGIGELALGPLMFGASNKLLNADHHDVYFKGMPLWKGRVLRRHGDVFERTSRGYYHAHGRADDTMNLGGIKVSSVEIERICNAADNSVLETAAIGVPPSGGGPEQLVIAVVFKDSENTTTDLNQLRISFNSTVQKKLNPLFRVSQVVPLSSLPRTASNKVMRRV
ncbi:hypothetical protein RGQ29_032885 [Quercus rubra]|uniref:AMP-dependent synthetase/ligase domain-containing protein n=1 Tax=Quercus rubra TaxID=3512 RepID=A0AAN7I5X2_QUERU|nr:hypothetical protein RGQ29_032885 [Quercus rubra]